MRALCSKADIAVRYDDLRCMAGVVKEFFSLRGNIF